MIEYTYLASVKVYILTECVTPKAVTLTWFTSPSTTPLSSWISNGTYQWAGTSVAWRRCGASSSSMFTVRYPAAPGAPSRAPEDGQRVHFQPEDAAQSATAEPP